MFPPIRKLSVAVTLLAFAMMASGGLVGCADSQDVPVRTTGTGSTVNHSPGYSQLPFGSSDPGAAAGIMTIDALLFGLSALTGGHPLAPGNDSSPSPFDQPPR